MLRVAFMSRRLAVHAAVAATLTNVLQQPQRERLAAAGSMCKLVGATVHKWQPMYRQAVVVNCTVQAGQAVAARHIQMRQGSANHGDYLEGSVQIVRLAVG